MTPTDRVVEAARHWARVMRERVSALDRLNAESTLLDAVLQWEQADELAKWEAKHPQSPRTATP